MNLKTDDLVLGYLHHIATFHPEKDILYIPSAKLSKEKSKIAWIINKSTATVKRKIEVLVEKKLINKSTLDGKEIYVIPQTTIGKYKIINDDMIWYILQTRTHNILKVYIYLLSKYDWKKQEQGEMYQFTCGEIAEAVGYSCSSASSGDITSLFSTILASLKREGIIDYECFYSNYNNNHVSPAMRLTFVAHSIDDLPPVD